MMHFPVQPRDPIVVKDYGFLYFAKNTGKNIAKNISKNLSSKYSLKLLNHAKKSGIDALKITSKRVIQKKTAETTGDLIGNKIANRITNVSRSLPQSNSGTITNERDKEIPKERYISPKERQLIIDDLRLK